MHVVLVLLTVKAEFLEEFERALMHNARESVQHDPGCVRFDVSQQQDDPSRWVLYEVYDAPEAHTAHRRSPHFLAYDAVATRAVVDKTVIRASGKYMT
jgi:autoinducer 2-degrading protein